jgi:hypothetical protein
MRDRCRETKRGAGEFEFDKMEALPVAACFMVGDGGSPFSSPSQRKEKTRAREEK